MQMNRTRIVFFVIVGLALLVVCVGVSYNLLSGLIERETPTPFAVVETRPPAEVQPTPVVQLESPEPVWAPGYDPNDGLPTYVCGADAFGSYFTLQQMQMSGKDVEHGFHLGIVPFLLDDNPDYDISEEQRTALLNSGQWDCLLTTLDSVALASPGIITAIVDESAGADQLWVRDVSTINDLKDKRIAFSRGSVGEYFVYYTLSIARLNPRFDVTLVPQDSVADAIEAFNAGQADAVSGWEPDIYGAEASGGVPLLSSSQMRIVIDVVVTSRQSIANKPDLVQDFHDAWFDTLKAQVENFDTAAAQIAEWGHNDWSFVYPESAAEDLTLWLESVAQADLGDNAFVMRDTTPIVKRLEIARRVWAASGAEVPDDDVAELVNPGFVSRSAAQAQLQANGNPVNDTFSISAQLDLSGVSTDDAATLVVLPCRRFSFVPESTELTLESRRILDDCVLPTLQQSVGLFLRVKGSAAWPGPPGTYTQEEILEFAEARAQSVVDYLVSQGIDPTRFIVEATLPPEDHWETEDPEKQAEDRYVEMTLITVGR
jgi:ABC-type nitrate/sulfonate/bicarbonate transport system substrate-binding protein/outer membrane protein OmpA-like peptidoglycan-associated protein